MKARAVLIASMLLAGCQTSYDGIQNKKDSGSLSAASLQGSNQNIYTSLNWLKSQNNTHDNLWVYISDGLSLPIPNNALIRSEKQRYLNSKTYFQQITDKSEPYMYWIVEQIEARNMPLEIALLPIVESAFNPHATSSARAAGLWQIVPTTGLYYGLKLNYWYDGRRDVAASTKAALDMLERLNKMFDGDWLLTIAAYNSGEGRVLNAIKANRAKGKPTDFWSLSLPKETSVYVPKLLALADIMKNHKKYAINLPKGNPKRALDSINIGKQVELIKVADMTGVPLTKLKALNAGYKHGVTPPEGPHTIMIPKSYTPLLQKALINGPDDLIATTAYITKSSDSLESLAKKFNSHVDAIRQANNQSDDKLIPGQKILIPRYNTDVTTSLASANIALEKSNSGYRISKGQYQVTSGDTLSGIAKKLGVASNELKKSNKLTNAHALKIGQKLNYQSNGNNTKKVTYKVSQGDTMTSISKKHKLDVNDVMHWNMELPNIHQLSLGDLVTLYVNK